MWEWAVTNTSQKHTAFLFGIEMSEVYDVFRLYRQVLSQTLGIG
jgi:hypothetical protein